MDGGRSGLSQREFEVLHLLAWGHTNKEIAEHLGVSAKTIEAHRANGLRKLGMKRRAELVRHAVRHGWLRDESAPAGPLRPD